MSVCLSVCRQVYFTTAVLSSLKPIRSALLRALTADGATASSARSSSCGRHGMPIRLLGAFQANRGIKRKAHAPRSARRCRLVRARRSPRCLRPRARTPGTARPQHGTARPQHGTARQGTTRQGTALLARHGTGPSRHGCSRTSRRLSTVLCRLWHFRAQLPIPTREDNGSTTSDSWRCGATAQKAQNMQCRMGQLAWLRLFRKQTLRRIAAASSRTESASACF
jgi:hypothetical protein